MYLVYHVSKKKKKGGVRNTQIIYGLLGESLWSSACLCHSTDLSLQSYRLHVVTQMRERRSEKLQLGDKDVT